MEEGPLKLAAEGVAADEGGPEEGVGVADLGEDETRVGIHGDPVLGEAAEELREKEAAIAEAETEETGMGLPDVEKAGGGIDRRDEVGFCGGLVDVRRGIERSGVGYRQTSGGGGDGDGVQVRTRHHLSVRETHKVEQAGPFCPWGRSVGGRRPLATVAYG